MTIDSYRAGDPAGTELMMRYDANKKSALLAYVIWFFLGWFGVHRLYLGRVVSGLLMLAIFAVSWLLHFVLIGFLGYLIIAPWWVIDAFLIPGITREHNNRLIERLRR
jgi:TM2 domain-containing membrane protein YozV